MLIPVDSVFFRQVNEINIRVLRKQEKGQYHVTLTADPELASFATELPETAITNLGGWTKVIPIEPFDGPDPVGVAELRFRYMGPQSKRRDFNLPAQATDTYPLWAEGRAFRERASAQSLTRDVLLIIKDERGKYHARWIAEANRDLLPEQFRSALDARRTGVYHVTETDSSPVSRLAGEIKAALIQHRNVLLYGPPATGKTHLVTEVIESLGASTLMIDTANEAEPLVEGGSVRNLRREWTTFHQSYSYEDFVVGLRPAIGSKQAGINLEVVPGVLLELAEWARQDGKSSLLIIDEINRGNVSRIFGEFITLMETDKRLADDGSKRSTTVELRLPYLTGNERIDLGDGIVAPIPTPFTMPDRVYTLATMNSVDKSVAPLDAAIRRRFHVVDIFPDFKSMADELGVDLAETGEASKLDTRAGVIRCTLLALSSLNEHISMFLGPDFQFGHWYLGDFAVTTDQTDAAAVAARIWSTRIFPQLQEYFAGRPEQLEATLGDEAFRSPALGRDTPRESLAELGAEPLIYAKGASDDEIVDLLQIIADNREV